MSLDLEHLSIALPLVVCVVLCDRVFCVNEYPLCRYLVCLQDTDSIHSYELNCIAQIHADIKALSKETVNKKYILSYFHRA